MPLSWVEIDLAALRHNLFQAGSRLAEGSGIVGVVKSDAYGHGMIPVARELTGCGVSFLAVSKYWEAKELRSAGIRTPVITLLGLEPEDMEEALQLGVRPALFRLDHARLLSRAASRLNLPARVHLKVDTGMGRLGVRFPDLPSFIDELSTLPNIEIEGTLSHFAEADEADKSYCENQVSLFRQTVRLLISRGFSRPYAHIANSAGIMDLPGAHFQLARPGIMLYGSQPSKKIHFPADLRPVMSFKAKAIQVKTLPAGHPVGYGRTFVARSEVRIATIPVGYDDGFPRLLSNRGWVLIRGKRAPVVGRVSMNMITADVSAIPEAREDDEVVILGSQGKERISAEEIAELCGSISYEIYCNIGKHRYKRFLNSLAEAPQ